MFFRGIAGRLAVFTRLSVYALIAIVVVDGDTIRFNGTSHRLIGFDTPETGYHARCEAEHRLGIAATHRLEELIRSGHAILQTSGRRDRYGRSLSRLYVDGRDVGDILIDEGFARPYDGGKRKSWCD
jgi:micrococcal nuclease